MNHQDDWDLSTYPKTLYRYMNYHVCGICTISKARFMVVEGDASFWCESCFDLFHYDGEGRMIIDHGENVCKIREIKHE